MTNAAQATLATADTPKKMMTTKETAAYLGVSMSTIYKMTMNREIPYYKPNGMKIYFDRSEVDSWQHRNKIYTDAELAQMAHEHSRTI